MKWNRASITDRVRMAYGMGGDATGILNMIEKKDLKAHTAYYIMFLPS